MYHFNVQQDALPLKLASRTHVTGHFIQFLKDFQVEAICFLSNRILKRKFCVLNDESGLGKTATTSVLLSVISIHKKTLIVVQNDEQIRAWQFHLSILTELTLNCLSKDMIGIDPDYDVYVVKWINIQETTALKELSFDIVILDNRGDMLSNSLCLSTMLEHFGKKINLVIYSADITANVKSFYNVLCLGGELEHHIQTFKDFEDKFKLPDLADISSKRIDLEEYFLRRAILVDYCKEFRLRRYCHQYSEQLPLVQMSQYKKNMQEWLNANSIGKHEMTMNGEIEESLVNISKAEFSNRKSSEEQISMSPLIFATDSEQDSEENKNVIKKGNHREFIDLSEDNVETQKKICMQDTESEQTKSSQNNNNENTKEKKASSKFDKKRSQNAIGESLNSQTLSKIKNTLKTKHNTKKAEMNIFNSNKFKVLKKPSHKKQTDSKECSTYNLRRSKRLRNVKADFNDKKSKNEKKNSLRPNILILKPLQNKIQTKNNKKKLSQKRDLLPSDNSFVRTTRAMERITRSTSNKCKYMLKNFDLDSQKKRSLKRMKSKLKLMSNNTRKSTIQITPSFEGSKKNVVEQTAKKEESHSIRSEVWNNPCNLTQLTSQLYIISPSDYQEIECGQKLTLSSSADQSCDVQLKTCLLHPTPPFQSIQNTTLCPRSLLFNASDISVIPMAEHEIITLSSSCSESQSLELLKSHRAYDFKPNKLTSTVNLNPSATLKTRQAFHQSIQNDREKTTSPDLFSNSSETVISWAQNKNFTNTDHTYERSCLNILEKIFKPQNHGTFSLEPALKSDQKRPKHNAMAIPLFEATKLPNNNERLKKFVKSSGLTVIERDRFKSTDKLRLDTINQSGQNKITDYIVGPLSQEPETQANQICVTPSKIRKMSHETKTSSKKCPKSPKPGLTQGNKLTRWFSQNRNDNVIIKTIQNN